MVFEPTTSWLVGQGSTHCAVTPALRWLNLSSKTDNYGTWMVTELDMSQNVSQIKGISGTTKALGRWFESCPHFFGLKWDVGWNRLEPIRIIGMKPTKDYLTRSSVLSLDPMVNLQHPVSALTCNLAPLRSWQVRYFCRRASTSSASARGAPAPPSSAATSAPSSAGAATASSSRSTPSSKSLSGSAALVMRCLVH